MFLQIPAYIYSNSLAISADYDVPPGGDGVA